MTAAVTSSGPPGPIRVLVADDQELVRSGFCVILDAADGITVVGEAANGRLAVAGAAEQQPDVVLMDVRMPEMDGLEATRLITGGAGPRPKVVMLTTFDLDDYVYAALRAGASGFLLKDAPRHDLIAAVRAAAAGNALLAPTVTRRLIERFARLPAELAPAPSQLAALTARERDILLQVARGRSNAEIAAALFLSEATVKTHIGHVLAKLSLRDRVQAVILAYEAGIVVPGEHPGAGRRARAAACPDTARRQRAPRVVNQVRNPRRRAATGATFSTVTPCAGGRAGLGGEGEDHRLGLVRRVDLQEVRGDRLALGRREVQRLHDLQGGVRDPARRQRHGLHRLVRLAGRGVADLAAVRAGHERDPGEAEQGAGRAGGVREHDRVVHAARGAVAVPDGHVQRAGRAGPGPGRTPVSVGEGCAGPPPPDPGDVGVTVTVTVLVTVGAAAGEAAEPQAVASSAVPASTVVVIRCRGTRRDVTVTSFPRLAAHYQPRPLDGGAGAPVAGNRPPVRPTPACRQARQ